MALQLALKRQVQPTLQPAQQQALKPAAKQARNDIVYLSPESGLSRIFCVFPSSHFGKNIVKLIWRRDSECAFRIAQYDSFQA